MRRVSTAVLVTLGLGVAASCGGSAFTTGGADAGGDGLSAEASSGGGKDAPGVDEPPPTCAGSFACVPAAPLGWNGPVELYAGSSSPPPCTASFASAYDGTGQLSAPAATCSCSCNASPTQCGAPPLSFFDPAVCAAGATSCYSTNLPPSVCKTVNDTTGCGAVATGSPQITAPASPVVGGSCSPKGAKQVPPPTWGTYAQACSSTTAVAQVDCLSGSVCAPKPAAPYGKTLCVSQPGDVACPGLGYSSKQVFYGGVNDLRTCTDCTCGALTGASCAASFEAFSSTDGSCSAGGITYPAPFACDPVNQPADFRLTITSHDGACAANSVSPTGAATPASPTTFCCLP